MIRCLLLAFSAIVFGWLSVQSPTAALAAPDPTVQVVGHSASTCWGAPSSTTTERGPLAVCDHDIGTTPSALPSRRASTRPDGSTAGAATTYTDRPALTDGARATTMTGHQGDVVGGDPCPFRGARLAANTAEKVTAACFVAGTPVLLADGSSKPIEDIAVGDQVTAYNPDTGQTETRDVVRTYVHHDVPSYDVTLDIGERVTTTSEHPFWVEGRGWTPAAQLRAGDPLRQPDGSTVAVQSVHATGQTATVYNFEVDGLHDYYVQAGNTWILVHNACDVAGLAHAAERHVAGGAKNIHASTFWDGTDLAQLADTSGAIGLRQANGNIQYVMSRGPSVGVDFQTGLPTNVFTVIRKPGGDLVTIFPGTSTAKLG